MSKDPNRKYTADRKSDNGLNLRRLIFMSMVLSLFPSVLIYVGKLRSLAETYFAVLTYTVILAFFGYVFYLNYEKKALSQMKALVKKEGIISGELIMINTEDKLKNVLSLEFERSMYFNRESSILFFDIDHLGEINALYGFNAGDQVIIEIILSTKKFVAETISLQGMGTIIARVKGDTFALVMPDIGENKAYEVAHQLKDVIENLKLGIDASITCRFAVMAINQWTSEERFLELAYEKLKLAKDYGRGVIL